MKIESLVFSLFLSIKIVNAVRGCTVIAIQPDLLWKKAVCDSDSSLLTKIPTGLPDALISLRITQQAVRHLDDGELRRLLYLEEFYLDSCRLEKVDPNVFKGLNRLRILSFRNNSLRLDDGGLLPETFYHLPALEVLDLSENPLGRIPSNFFPNSLGKSLFELRLSHIKGELPLELEAAPFAALRNLQILDLSFCKLETISRKFRSVLNRMAKLRELQLGGNPWHCDCNLRWLREWYLSETLPSMQLSYDRETKLGEIHSVTPICNSPYSVKERFIFIPSGRDAIEPEEFICKQWIDAKQKHISVALGSNLSLSCQGYFEWRKNVLWFKNHLPLVTPSPNYAISQTNSLDFTAYLNITHVRFEDTGIWECGLDEGGGLLQKASINVTVEHLSEARSASWMDEAQRQNYLYAGIGVAIVFVLLAATALTIFCCWDKRSVDKSSVILRCTTRLQKNKMYQAGLSNTGISVPESVGPRAANNHSDSPVHTIDWHAINDKNKLNPSANNQTSITISNTMNCLLPTNDKTKSFLENKSTKFISLTTATTTTAVLTQPASATVYKQPVSLHSTILVSAEISSPSNTSGNTSHIDFSPLSLSRSHGATSILSRIPSQITGITNNPFPSSAICPIHGISTQLPNCSREEAAKTSILDLCPIHDSPESIALKKTEKKTASSFTQTPRYTAKSKSMNSLPVVRNGIHKFSHPLEFPFYNGKGLIRSDHLLPSRITSGTVPSCPIHGQVVPYLMNRRSSSMNVDEKSLFPSRNRRTESAALGAIYCSSCASTSSSDVLAETGADFEEYSSDSVESPAVECSDSGSSGYVKHSMSNGRKQNFSVSSNRSSYANSSISSAEEEITEITPASVFSDEIAYQINPFISQEKRSQQNQIRLTPHTILGEPLLLTAVDGRSINNALLSRSTSNCTKLRECLLNQPNNVRHHHSKQGMTLSPLSSFNPIYPKSILVKNSLHRKRRKKPSDLDNGTTGTL